jgi:hypothetical protein
LPFITSIFPLGGRAGAKTSVDVQGWNLPVTRLTPAFPEAGIHPLFLRKRYDVLSERRLDSLLDAVSTSKSESVS